MAKKDQATAPTVTETHYPLLFTFRHRVVGKGYVAGITTDGRALVKDEGDGDWWIDCVFPAWLGAGGKTFDEAVANLKRSMELVFFDFAEEADDLADFRDRLDKQFSLRDEETEQAWELARAAVRAGDAGIDGLGQIKQPRKPSVKIAQLELRPSANEVDGPTVLAA